MLTNKNDFCVIMCGGAGTRFWPVSRSNKPKQFLDFFSTGKTLVRMTFERLAKVVPLENIFIVTNVLYKNLVLEQLPEISENQILLEPCKRNTAPCIVWSSYHIHKINPQANIVVTPSDHLILKEDEFVRVVEKGLRYVEERNRLLTIGIVPTKAESGYGYIQMDENKGEDFFSVRTFIEKPDKELAQTFLDCGEFLWNSGMFIWKVKTLIEEVQQYLPEMSSCFENGYESFCTPQENEYIDQFFPGLRNISIDYGVMERSKVVDVLKGDLGWCDVGTWSSYYELGERDGFGNVIPNRNALMYNSKGNFIQLPKGIVAVVEGLENCIVVETEQELLICRMEDEQHIRQFAADVQLKFGEKFG
ncbi:MAG TPA: mannose-1-phosphate guanylyltransferase [Porphyromonadaceae bacterium]|nr:mannose-1-phosphate guanylyltransferase [Porphyromonadaceae bacterium]